MLEFARYISDRWGISEQLAKVLCSSYKSGCSPFYVADYDPLVACEVELPQVCDIFDFLHTVAGLAPKKKRVLSALSKSSALAPGQEDRVNLSMSDSELDDLLAAHKVNPRSLGQLAIAKGLGSLADQVMLQADELALEEAATALVGRNPSLKTTEDVLNGVKDILVERFAADETVRAMVREYGAEKGLLEVIPKSKKDKKYASYLGKLIDAHGLVGKELLSLMADEERKEIRLKVSVQLFQITELLREHFITNPDSQAFDLICTSIDECWTKTLQPIVEKEVKVTLRTQSEEIVSRVIASELSLAKGSRGTGPCMALGFVKDTSAVMVALTSDGHLLGATSVGLSGPKAGPAFGERLRQFFTRYHPSELLISTECFSPETEVLVRKSLGDDSAGVPITQVALSPAQQALAESAWIQEKFTDLDPAMRATFVMAIAHLKPINLISQIGVQYFALHPLQELISVEKMSLFVSRLIAESELRNGIPVTSVGNSVLSSEAFVPAELAAEFHKPGTWANVNSKRELMTIPGMTETIFRNIAGYIVVPQSGDVLDRTLVHPDHFHWVSEMAAALGVPMEEFVADPETVRSYGFEDHINKLYAEKKLIPQLRVGQKHQATGSAAARRRMKLADLLEGSVVQGRVTNITQFGVFVDINAVCDGLIHISQLADAYVETPDQVVSLGDRLNVRIVKIDIKKRRVSLSMKNMGTLAPKIRPSEGQLSTLADHFKNR